MSVIQIAANAVIAKLYHAEREAKLIVSELLSYRVEGAEHMAAFKSGNWDGRSTFFEFKEGRFPAGFVPVVQAALSKRGYNVQLVRKPLPLPQGPEAPAVDSFGFDPRYDYQLETMRQLVRRGSMIAQVATGGGKSRIAKLCFARIRRPTLFLTTRGVLMYQMKESFEETMGLKVGVIGDSEFSPRKGMNVGMVQTIAQAIEEKSLEAMMEDYLLLLKRQDDAKVDALKAALVKKKTPIDKVSREIAQLRVQLSKARPSDKQIAQSVQGKFQKHMDRRRKMLKLLEYFEFIIGEEAHEAGGNGYYEILKHCKNAHYRLALTATPFMRDDGESNMRLMACFGQIGIRISEQMLIERGILARPYFKHLTVEKPAKLFRTSPYQRAYKIGIVEHAERNKAIVTEAMRARKYGLPTMILVQHKQHGQLLKAMLTRAGVRTAFIFGDSNQAERKATLGKLAAGKLDALIGSTILDVGVDVPAVGMVILAGGGKAEVALRQRIGRGLRAKKSGPNIAFIVDFADEGNSHLKTHALTRRAIVESTPGFAEGVLADGEDFPFDQFRKAA